MIKKNSVENLERDYRGSGRDRGRQISPRFIIYNEYREAWKRQWKVGGRSLEEMIIFMKQTDKEKIGREFRETTEAVAETEVAR